MGRFISKDPFPGITPLPQSLHPYTYCFNNPVNHTDPSGELPHLLVTTLVGAILGGTIGGIGYALTHRGDAFNAQGLGQAMLIGVAGGAVAGLVAGAVPMLLPAAANVWGAMGIGALTGALSAGAGQVTANVLTPCVTWSHNLGWAMLFGGVAGGVFGGIGYGVRQWWGARAATHATRTGRDLFASGNKARPRPPRPGVDVYPDSSGVIRGQRPPLPNGASTFGDVSKAPLTGQYHRLPEGTQLPDGLAFVADGIDVIADSPHPATHHTIYPVRDMSIDDFIELFLRLPWEYVARKK
jgi:hypothetical protein